MSSSSTRLILAIFCCFAVKILLAVYIPLVNDEAYAIAVSREFSLSFFDHPPIGFWSSLIFTEPFGLQNYFLFRLPYLIFGFGTTWILFQIGRELGGHSVGLWTALIYNIAPFYLISGGFFIVPDGPLNLGIAASALCIIKLHKTSNENHRFFLILLGICLAWSFASKYQGFLFGLGCLMVLIISPKKGVLLRDPYFYLSITIALMGLVPTILWNSNHDWVSFQFHGARQGNSIHLINFFLMLFGMMIYLLPSIVLIPIAQIISYVNKNKKLKTFHSMEVFLVVMCIPNLVIFLLVFLFSERTFPHWIMPGWLLLLPAIARTLSISRNRLQRLFFGGSVLIIWPLLGLLIIHTQTGVLTNYSKNIPPWDNTLEVLDWRPIREPLQYLIDQHTEAKEPKLAALTWTEAGQLSVAMQTQFETLVIEGDPHHFAFLKKSSIAAPTFLVKISLGLNPDIETTLHRIRKYDVKAIHLKDIDLSRGGKGYATASIYLLTI